jgi:hypothetical protein
MYNNIKFYTPPPKTPLQNARIWAAVILEVIQYAILQAWKTLLTKSKTRQHVKP